MQLVTDSLCLPGHTFKHRSDFAISNLNAFHNSLVIDGIGEHVDIVLHTTAIAVDSMKQSNGCHSWIITESDFSYLSGCCHRGQGRDFGRLIHHI